MDDEHAPTAANESDQPSSAAGLKLREPTVVDLSKVTTEDLPLLMDVLEHQPQWNQNILIQRLQTMATHEDGEAVASAVEKFVTSHKWKVRRAAWRILGTVPGRAWQSFLQCCDSAEPSVRRDAIAALRFWVVPADHEQEVCELIASSLDDSHAEVRMAALDLMQDMSPGDEEAKITSFKLLLRRLEDSNLDIRAQALSLLCLLFQSGAMQREAATEMAHAVIKTLDGIDFRHHQAGQFYLRRVCVQSLGHLTLLGCDVAKSYLYKLQLHEDPEIRLVAYESLGTGGTKGRQDRNAFIQKRYCGRSGTRASKELSEDQLEQLYGCMTRATFGTEGWRFQIRAAGEEKMEPTDAAAQCFRHFASSMSAPGRQCLTESLRPPEVDGSAADPPRRPPGFPADFCSEAEIKVASRLSQLLADPSQLPRPQLEKRKPRWQEMVANHERRT